MLLRKKQINDYSRNDPMNHQKKLQKKKSSVVQPFAFIVYANISKTNEKKKKNNVRKDLIFNSSSKR